MDLITFASFKIELSTSVKIIDTFQGVSTPCIAWTRG